MKRYRYYHFALLIVLLAAMMLNIAGCAQNKPSLPTPDGSNPNEYSAYLFSAGNILYYNGDFANAEGVFRMALLYDSQSSEIRKALFNTMLHRTENNEISLSRFQGFVDSLFVRKAMDKTMMEQAYNLYAKREDNLNAKSILENYLKKYASARAYTSLFYLEQTLYNKSRFELLEKAYKLAGNDAPFLNSLGYLYLAFDSTKAEAIWQNAKKYDTTTQSAKYLWGLYSHQNNSVKLHKLWNSFKLPEDKDKLTEIVSYAFENSDFESVVMLRDVIIASGEPVFNMYLMQASLFAKENGLFEQVWQKLQSMQLTKLDKQISYFYAALFYIGKDNYSEALKWITYIDGKNTLDELIKTYQALTFIDTQQNNKEQDTIIKTKFLKTVEPATDAQLAYPVKRYLLTVIDSLSYDKDMSVPDSIALECVNWFYSNHRRTYDTYFWLALYYNKIKQDSLAKAILREALDEYPEDAAMLNWLGYSYVLSGDNLDEAEILIKRALQLSPDNAYYLDSLAWLYFLKGDFKQAVALMEIPERLEKLPAEIAYHLGSIYNAVNDKDKAIQYLKLAIEINDDPETTAKARELLDTLQ